MMIPELLIVVLAMSGLPGLSNEVQRFPKQVDQVYS